MLRTSRARTVASAICTAMAALLLAALTACGPAPSPADDDAIAERASVFGIAPELVYTTEVEGYDLAPQSVGPFGSEGMSATWFDDSTGAMLTLRTERGALTEASCAQAPLEEAPGQPVTCTREDGVWDRSAGELHEFVAERDGALIRVSGMNGVPPDDLRAAAVAARAPSDAELDLLFSDAPDEPGEPVERGDLPDNGDGAPIDPVGPGG